MTSWIYRIYYKQSHKHQTQKPITHITWLIARRRVHLHRKVHTVPTLWLEQHRYRRIVQATRNDRSLGSIAPDVLVVCTHRQNGPIIDDAARRIDDELFDHLQYSGRLVDVIAKRQRWIPIDGTPELVVALRRTAGRGKRHQQQGGNGGNGGSGATMHDVCVGVADVETNDGVQCLQVVFILQDQTLSTV